MAKVTRTMGLIGPVPTKKAAPIKVKQDMIDSIKAQGMTRALKRAGEISAKGTKGEAEFLEGVRRMYGASRVAAATKAATTATASKKPVASKMVTKPSAKPAAKKSTTTDPVARAFFGATKKVGAALTPDWKKKEQAAKKSNK